MGDNRLLSFSTTFNQPKILIDSSRAVAVPVSAPNVADTLFTVETNSVTKPLPPRIAVERGGIFAPAFGSGGDTFEVLGVNIQFIVSYDVNNRLVVKSYSQEFGVTNMTIYYRIYRDSRSV